MTSSWMQGSTKIMFIRIDTQVCLRITFTSAWMKSTHPSLLILECFIFNVLFSFLVFLSFWYKLFNKLSITKTIIWNWASNTSWQIIHRPCAALCDTTYKCRCHKSPVPDANNDFCCQTFVVVDLTVLRLAFFMGYE